MTATSKTKTLWADATETVFDADADEPHTQRQGDYDMRPADSKRPARLFGTRSEAVVFWLSLSGLLLLSIVSSFRYLTADRVNEYYRLSTEQRNALEQRLDRATEQRNRLEQQLMRSQSRIETLNGKLKARDQQLQRLEQRLEALENK